VLGPDVVGTDVVGTGVEAIGLAVAVASPRRWRGGRAADLTGRHRRRPGQSSCSSFARRTRRPDRRTRHSGRNAARGPQVATRTTGTRPAGRREVASGPPPGVTDQVTSSGPGRAGWPRHRSALRCPEAQVSTGRRKPADAGRREARTASSPRPDRRGGTGSAPGTAVRVPRADTASVSGNVGRGHAFRISAGGGQHHGGGQPTGPPRPGAEQSTMAVSRGETMTTEAVATHSFVRPGNLPEGSRVPAAVPDPVGGRSPATGRVTGSDTSDLSSPSGRAQPEARTCDVTSTLPSCEVELVRPAADIDQSERHVLAAFADVEVCLDVAASDEGRTPARTRRVAARSDPPCAVPMIHPRLCALTSPTGTCRRRFTPAPRSGR
jgi:hypothetical protein